MNIRRMGGNSQNTERRLEFVVCHVCDFDDLTREDAGECGWVRGNIVSRALS